MTPTGIEPVACGLGNRRSIQLSYGVVLARYSRRTDARNEREGVEKMPLFERAPDAYLTKEEAAVESAAVAARSAAAGQHHLPL